MTHYATLGVPQDATPEQIKAAFRKLASQHHPDRGGDKEKSAAVNDAYACLGDPERRARYDAGQADELPPSPEELLRQKALKVLGAVIDAVLEGPDVEPRGLVRTLRQELEHAAQQFKEKASGFRKAAQRFERIKAKILRKGTDGDDLVGMILTGKIADQVRKEAETLDAVEQVRAAVGMLDAYENEAVSVMAPSQRNAQAELINAMMSQAFNNGRGW